MKKAYRPVPKSRTASVSQIGAIVAMVAGVLVLAGAAFAFWQSSAGGPSPNFTPEAKGAPRLRADRQKVDLGNIKLGQTVQVSFEIADTGDQPLRFTGDPFVEVVEGC